MEKERNLKWYQDQVKKLQAIPSDPQRSPEWFKARHTRITASEGACCLTLSEEICKQYTTDFNIKKFKYNPNACLSHYDTKQDYIINKCRTFYGENLFKDSIYTLHGKKFEEIATRLYRKKFNTNVIEFGLLLHPSLKYIAASPDGITPNGIMLEIKCPYSRKIEEGVPPIWYWTQMQIQLAVADLDQCDFLECEIKEVDLETFKSLNPKGNQDLGILLNKVSEPDNSETKYIYPPDHLDTIDDFINWSSNTISGLDVQVVPIYYFIQKWFVVNVYRRQEWFNSVKHYFEETCNVILDLQSSEDNFKKYRESIHLIKSKKFFEMYNNSCCEFSDSDSTFVFDSESETEPEFDHEQVCLLD